MPLTSHAHTLIREPIRVVGRLGHPIHALRAPSLRQLAQYPWVFPLEQTRPRVELEDFFVRSDFEIPSNRAECSSILTWRATPGAGRPASSRSGCRSSLGRPVSSRR